LERQGAALYNARATVGFFETMPGRLPPISALRALEAAARHMSFTRAAHELNVTQSAISHQIKTLEGLWSLKLFKRTVRGVTLTPTGEELAKITREFFDRMTRTLDELRISSTHEPLRVDTLQSFAVKSLVPRLGRFHAIHPEIDVWISTHDRLVDFGSDDVDLAIRLGHGQYPGLHTSLLMREEVYPVCTPEFFANDGLPRSPRDLLDYPLLLRLGEPNHPNWVVIDPLVRPHIAKRGIRLHLERLDRHHLRIHDHELRRVNQQVLAGKPKHVPKPNLQRP